MVKHWLSAITPKNARERSVLGLGLVAVFIGFYFFAIEPLQKKAVQQQQTADTRWVQLSEMQRMASELLAQSTAAPRQLLQGKIATETLEGGKPLLKTQPLSGIEAKQLLRQLAVHGKTAIYSAGDTLQTVWFWEEK